MFQFKVKLQKKIGHAMYKLKINFIEIYLLKQNL